MHIEAAGEQGAGSKGEDLQVLPNHACDAICRRNSLSPTSTNINCIYQEVRINTF
ncbi:MAG: hypothetical protein V7L23_07935 [Nostoc sp.]|uniref:hypothetical protein n=1 Tax=Nostoc sp. TaxID=1180 RepID=UPI002FF01ADA